jgi:plasmid stabilization system protein ParE
MKCFMRREARRELTDATDYYEGMREGLGDEFIEDFLLAITEIEEAPRRWPESEPGVRRFRLSRFPYAIYYRVLTAEVDIVAFAHHAQREGYWRDRLQ